MLLMPPISSSTLTTLTRTGEPSQKSASQFESTTTRVEPTMHARVKTAKPSSRALLCSRFRVAMRSSARVAKLERSIEVAGPSPAFAHFG